MRGIRRPNGAAATLPATAPVGPGWVYATVARLTYGRRLGFSKYDLALSAEDAVVVLHTSWGFVGIRRRVPLVEVIAEGWVPRPAQLHRR